MDKFTGFPEGKTHNTPIPDLFFQQLLPRIEHPGELKLTLYIFYFLGQSEGAFRFIRRADIQSDANFLKGLAENRKLADLILDEALELMLERGSLLSAELEIDGKKEICFFLNSPRGRAAVRAIQSGQWKITAPLPIKNEISQPNIFQLYEKNIGPLSPIIAEELGEAQDAFPDEWITEAFGIAVEKDKRSWRYVLAILERWQREGYHGRKEKSEDRRSSPEARRRYVEGEFSEHIEH
jgi:DNA replication protein